MKLPWPLGPEREDRTPRLGTVSPVDCEVHDSVGNWYYYGRVEMFEKEYDLPPDTENLGRGKSQPEKQKLYFYRLLTSHKEDERIIVTDVDLVQNGDQIPYTRTRKGHNRMFQVILLTFGFIYALTLYMTALFVTAGPSIIYYSQQVADLELGVGEVASLFAGAAIIYAWAARYHHFVLDWEVQPLRIDSVRVSADFYILTNSSKSPVFPTTLRLAKLERAQVDSMVQAVRSFEKEELDKLQNMLASTRKQLEITEIQATANYLDRKEAAMMTETHKDRQPLDTVKWASAFAGVAITCVVIGMLLAFGVT